jgi:flavin-dependent dehydrogenase
MKQGKLQYIAIIGSGPAACLLATRLRNKGKDVMVFAPKKRPSLLVGESLIPATVATLRDLGVESRIESFGTLKGGAVLSSYCTDEWVLHFAHNNTGVNDYAYNVPRDRFDAMMQGSCMTSGAIMIPVAARCARHGTDDVELLGEARDIFFSHFRTTPDFIIDATGRARLLSTLCERPFRRTKQDDISLFSHFESQNLQHQGYLHMDVTPSGWLWRIPLPGKTSIGAVFSRKYWSENPEIDKSAMLINCIKEHAAWQTSLPIAPVMQYQNYSLIGENSRGGNWVAVGDALGFVDPVFSSGLHLALLSAEQLASCLMNGTPLEQYCNTMTSHYNRWQKLVETFYDRRLFRMIQAAQIQRGIHAMAGISKNVQEIVTRVLSGLATDREWNLFFLTLDFSTRQKTALSGEPECLV